MKIYLDIYILENIIVDMFLLILTSKIIKLKINNKRLILSSIIGGIYSTVMIFPQLKILASIPFQAVVAFVMNHLFFNGSKLFMKVKSTIIYIISALTLSGLCFTLALCKGPYNISKSYTIMNYSLKNLVLAIIIIYLVYERITSYIKDRVVVSNLTYDIELSLDNTKYIIRGFLDTGNELREPITNLPCIIIEENYLYNYVLKEEDTYYIPYSAIGYNGKLQGFKGDKIRIKKDGEEWQEIQAIICPCKEVLSRDREFNALLSRGVI